MQLNLSCSKFFSLSAVFLSVATTFPLVSAQAEVRSTVQGDRDTIKAIKDPDQTVRFEYCKFGAACTPIGNRSYSLTELHKIETKERRLARFKIGGEIAAIPLAALAGLAASLGVGAAIVYPITLTATGGVMEDLMILPSYFSVFIAAPVSTAVWLWDDAFNPRKNNRIAAAVSQDNIADKDVRITGSVAKSASDLSHDLGAIDGVSRPSSASAAN
jgi:hypothetical protein